MEVTIAANLKTTKLMISSAFTGLKNLNTKEVLKTIIFMEVQKNNPSNIPSKAFIKMVVRLREI